MLRTTFLRIVFCWLTTILPFEACCRGDWEKRASKYGKLKTALMVW
jgi:hypothetical protein